MKKSLFALIIAAMMLSLLMVPASAATGEELLKEERLAKENGDREKMLAIRRKRRATLRVEEEYTHKIHVIGYEKNDILNGSKEGRINHYLNQNNLNFYEYELDSNFNLAPEYLWLD